MLYSFPLETVGMQVPLLTSILIMYPLGLSDVIPQKK